MHHLHKERVGNNNSSLMNQTVMTDVGVKMHEGIQSDGVAIVTGDDNNGDGQSFVN